MQLIFEGVNKGRVCPDSSKYAATVTTTCTDNNWANVASTLEFLELIVTHRSALIDAGDVPPHSPALLVWDVFYARRDKAVLDFCRANNIFLVFVPAKLNQLPAGLRRLSKQAVEDRARPVFPGPRCADHGRQPGHVD